MTDERHDADTGQVTDERVSEVYRELAKERAPEKLNRTVLRASARAARPPYARSVIWARPVAWAATIAICLAITLQVARLSTSEDAAVMRLQEVTDAPPTRPATEALPRPGERHDTFVAEPATPEDEAGGAADTGGAGPVETGYDASAQALAPPQNTPLEKQQLHERASTGVAEDPALPSSAADFELRDADPLRRAGELERAQSGADREPGRARAAAYATSTSESGTAADGCDAEARTRPETWLACIVRLEEAGLKKEANHQREQLAAAFPDFDAP